MRQYLKNHSQFLESFSQTREWDKLKEILNIYKEEVSKVKGEYQIDDDGATYGELYAGRMLATTLIDEFINDIHSFKPRKNKKMDERDNMN